MSREDDLKQYTECLCPHCTYNKECDHNKLVINTFNKTRNVKCFDYEWKDKKD